MHDISAEAGISVGLIYRYFENKEAVIAAMADRHKSEISDLLERAGQAPSATDSGPRAACVPRPIHSTAIAAATQSMPEIITGGP